MCPWLYTTYFSLVTYNELVFAPGCTDDIFSSDHSPVFATFEVGVTSQLSSKTGAVMVTHITNELRLIPPCWPNSVVIPFAWWHRSNSEHWESLDRAGRNRGHSEDVEQGQVLHRAPLLLPWRCEAGPSSKQILLLCRLCRQPTKHTVVSLCRHTALKCEWLAELQRYRVPPTGMVLQTAAKGFSFRPVWKNPPKNTKC